MNRSSIPLVALSFLAGCATAPTLPITADNPASPAAPEAIEEPLRNVLATDALTRKTQQIFAQSEKPEAPPSPTPTQQVDQMPGMKMP